MIRYSLKRFLFSIPLLLGVTLLTFAFIQMTPGDFLGTLKLNPQISREAIQLYEEQFHLDKPVLQRYFIWLKNLARLDLGYSFSYKAPVKAVIASRALNTLILALSAIFLSWIFVIPLGIIAARHKNKFIDKALSFVSYLGISTPSFFLAFIFLYFAFVTRWLPLGGKTSIQYEEFSTLGKILDVAKHLILPTVVLSVGRIAALQRVMRSNLLESLGSPYILSAKAKGLSQRRIFYIHALRNAINPMITIFGYQFSALLSGAALTEIIIGWPGLGQVMLEAVRMQDVYLVMGSVLIGGILLISGNLLADILLAFSDPRIRYEK